MTKEEILDKTSWDYYNIGNCPLFVNLFGQEIPFIFFQEHEPKPSITDKMTECVNDVLSLAKSEIETIKEMLWEECNFAFEVADYGYRPKELENHLEAHLNGFGILNKEDSYLKSQIKEIHIAQENDNLHGRYAEIKIDSSSDNLISIIVKNGKIIDFDDDGTFLGWFENDEQHAKKAREKTLKD
jgi:hypothetical protein